MAVRPIDRTVLRGSQLSTSIKQDLDYAAIYNGNRINFNNWLEHCVHSIGGGWKRACPTANSIHSKHMLGSDWAQIASFGSQGLGCKLKSQPKSRDRHHPVGRCLVPAGSANKVMLKNWQTSAKASQFEWFVSQFTAFNQNNGRQSDLIVILNLLRKMLQRMKDQSRRRRILLAEQLGAGQSDELSRILGTQEERNEPNRDVLTLPSYRSSLLGTSSSIDILQSSTPTARFSSSHQRILPQSKLGSSTERLDDVSKLAKKSSKRTKLTHSESKDSRLIPEEQVNSTYEYKGSSAFLKGTQSANPHNDYCQHYVDTGQRPQNFIRDYELHDRFEEYPKLKELIRLKDELIAKTATTPMYLKTDLRHPGQLAQLECKFDVILIDPPLEEYQRTQGVTKTNFWSWDSILHLEIEEIAASRSFIFLWCGSSDGLDLGRKCLRKWGFRRCEDICWIKTNKNNIGHNKNLEPKAIFQRTKEHCLMGIKGTVRRSTDGDFIHSNVDIDLIISEEPVYGSYEKPDEIFHIIEHFCLGRRRLHLFGRDSTIRPGWLTVGPELTNSNFNAEIYKDCSSSSSNEHLSCFTEKIESLRPKSPPAKNVPSGAMMQAGFSRKRF